MRLSHSNVVIYHQHPVGSLFKYIIVLNLHPASLFPTFNPTTDNLTQHVSRVCNIDLPNSRTAREFARLEANFAGINIGNSHVTHSLARRESQIPDKMEGILLFPLQIRDSSNSEGTIPCASTSPNLCSPIFDSSQYITLHDEAQHSTRMRCFFHYQ